jgi:two-component system cell cycle response regulator DivK
MSKRILVVEDQEDNRQIIRDMLTATDYEIIEAESGEDALSAVAKQRPDLILMDIQLPGIDGYETTRRIKADPALRSITIIAVTSCALSGEEEKARAAGCDEYVPQLTAAPPAGIGAATCLRARPPSCASAVVAAAVRLLTLLP